MFQFSGRPLFVLGNPRAGTRMVANILNAHGQVVVSDEFKAFEGLAETLDAIERGRGKKLPDWHREKAYAASQLLIDASPASTRRKAADARYFVNKTPSAIFRLKEIEAIWGLHRPAYVYCIRHPLRILRSLANMPWNRNSPRKNLKRMYRSMRVLRDLRQRRDVKVAQVDTLSAPDTSRAFVLSLFEFAGITPDDRVLRYAEKPLSPANAAEKHTPGGQVDELPERTVRRIRRHRHYRAICREFGYEL